ncbi:MAG: hypothetical protein JWP97_531 [Labilithrix sp.]|nr:hypothetical protein [Labilithrix sp.]
MRSALSVVLGIVSLSLFAACGDASESSGNQRTPNIKYGEVDGEPILGEKESNSSNPGTDVAPPPPASAGESTGSVGMALSNAAPLVDLGDSVELTVTVTPKDGTFKGDVDLTATGLPSGVTATFTPAKVTVNGAPATATVKLTADVTAALAAAPAAIAIKGTSGTTSATANANFKVNPKLKLTIPMNVAALRAAGAFSDKWGAAFGPTPTAITIPAEVGQVDIVVYNGDSTKHIVHGNGGATGFPHGDTTAGKEIAPNTFEADPNDATKNRVRALKPGFNDTGYMHELGTGGGFQIKAN